MTQQLFSTFVESAEGVGLVVIPFTYDAMVALIATCKAGLVIDGLGLLDAVVVTPLLIVALMVAVNPSELHN